MGANSKEMLGSSADTVRFIPVAQSQVQRFPGMNRHHPIMQPERPKDVSYRKLGTEIMP